MKQLDFPDGSAWVDESSEDENGYVNLHVKIHGKWEFFGKLLKEPKKFLKKVKDETT